ncbi:MAG TPA: type II CAAX endopeptidase family protein [Usitatibacter sp.]|nr:type II CAAX endopeptidase family protein [Usitatibacter sp.]
MDQPATLKPLGARLAILLFVGFVVVQVVAGFAIGIWVGVWKAITSGVVTAPSKDLVLLTAMWGAVVGSIASGIFLLLAVRRRFPELGWNRGGAGTVPAAVGVGIVLAGLVLALITAIPPAHSRNFGMLVQASMSRGAALYLWAFLGIVLAPLLEELMFRGILWTGFSHSFDARIAAVLTTGLFVAMHLPETGRYWPAILGVTLLGAATLSARVWSRSLAPAIALHLSYNVVICGTVLVGSISGKE